MITGKPAKCNTYFKENTAEEASKIPQSRRKAMNQRQCGTLDSSGRTALRATRCRINPAFPAGSSWKSKKGTGAKTSLHYSTPPHPPTSAFASAASGVLK
jgi:hypothetical protein